eukprot:TRINITY_DN1734_c0_g1_i1.p1 TRINITY_DN1734_c0_g1~~TRINITY_DN1734_c0_g1_i1.p1  ORF type:complete len:343 (+),score=69.55 TRINITY_DN1734_c0_g1_i1:181-1209(+)
MDLVGLKSELNGISEELLEENLVETLSGFEKGKVHQDLEDIIQLYKAHLHFGDDFDMFNERVIESFDENLNDGELLMEVLERHLITEVGATVLLQKFPMNAYYYSDPDFNTVAHVAAQRDFHHIIRKLIDINPDLKYSRNNDGESALHIACASDASKCVKVLLEDTPPEYRETQNHYGAIGLHFAIVNCDLDTIKLLLDDARPEMISIRSQLGFTALHYVLFIKLKDECCNIAESLLSHGESNLMEITDQQRNTLLNRFCENTRSSHLMEVLVKYITPEVVRIKNMNGRTAFGNFARENDASETEAMLKLLLGDMGWNTAIDQEFIENHSSKFKELLPVLVS